jgi:hypothetical protein
LMVAVSVQAFLTDGCHDDVGCLTHTREKKNQAG